MKLYKPVINEKLGRGQFTFRRKENMLVLRYKKEIFLLSTMHTVDILMVESEVTVMSKSLKSFTTKIEKGERWTKTMQ